MSLVRLESGFLEQDDAPIGDATKLEKRALLVYAGKFDSMDGPVDVTPDKLSKLVKNHNSFLSKVARMASGDAHPRIYPPVQLDHSTSARDTVGRLVGEIEDGKHTVDGVEVPAIFGRLRILGRDNVEKVQDGRWTNLSLGVDFEKGKINELTITPFPAAKDAHMLSQGQETKQGEEMSYKEAKEKMGRYAKYKTAMTRWAKMSEEDSEKHLEEDSEECLAAAFDEHKKDFAAKCKKHLMDKGEKEDDAEAKMAAMSDEDMDKMADSIHVDVVEGDHPVVEEKEDSEMKKMIARLSAIKEGITNMRADFDEGVRLARLEAKKGQVMIRLSALRSEAKISPAEIKKIDVARLASETDETIDAVFKTYTSREPVIPVGLFGNAKAEDISKVSEKLRMQKLEDETRQNMSLVRNNKTQKTRMSMDPVETPKMSDSIEVKKPHAEQLYSEMKKLISEGKDDEAMKLLAYYMPADSETSVESKAMESQIEKMSAAIAALKSKFETTCKLVSE